MEHATRILLGCLLAIGLGCMGGSGPEGGDGANDSFGGNAVKADGGYAPCLVLEVLETVNEATTTVDALRDLGVRSNAAENIVAHRNGPDGDPGTADDDIFDDLMELDDVSYVGPVTLDLLVDSVRDRCAATLDRPYIDQNTFAGSTGGGWTRDNVELEATMTVRGVTGQRLNAILKDTDSRGRTIFSRLRRNELMEAFTLGYAIDEMPWDRDSHEAREAIPYVPLTIERGRYEPDDDDARELSLGTDIMDDIYYDTDDYLLLHSDMVVRGRVRWDNADEIRRLLIAAKFGSEIGADGIKRTGKIDVRTDNPDPHVGSFDEDVRRGIVSWSGRETPVEPLRAVYEQLLERDVLPTVQGLENVLLLEPMAHLRSTRSRYHLDVPRRDSVVGLVRNGEARLRAAIDMAQAALDAGIVDSGDEADVRDFMSFGEQVLSGSAIAARLGAAPAALPIDFRSTAASVDELNENRRVAEAMDTLFHEISDRLDDVDRAITGTSGLDGDEYVDMFVEWQKSVDASLRLKRVAHPFLAAWEGIDAAADRDTQIAAFQAYGDQQRSDANDDFEDFETVDADVWAALGAHLRFETLKISQRQIAYAGTCGEMLWFDQAREHWIPASNRPSGNFLIDTFDMTEMVTHEMWETMTADEHRIDAPLDPAKVFHTVVVDEVQIELGQEEAFVERVNELQALVDAGTATPEDEAALEQVRFVFDQYIGLMQTIAELKGDEIVDRLDREGAPDAEWTAAEYSKGETALRILADLI